MIDSTNRLLIFKQRGHSHVQHPCELSQSEQEDVALAAFHAAHE